MKVSYKGKDFSVAEGRIRKNGKEIAYAEVVEPDVAVILPILENDTILIERNFRPVLGKFIYELPAGHLNRGEKPAEAAKRELAEETGYRAKTLKLEFVAYSTPGRSKSKFFHFVASGLCKGNTHLDKDEIISIRRIKIEKALGMIRSKQIMDEKSIAFLEYYARGKFHGRDIV